MRTINTEQQTVDIELLKHHPRNANNGDVQAITKSLAVNGWYGTVVVNKATMHILAGNHRVMAARELGWSQVPVQYVDVTPAQELRILMADNRTNRLGQDSDTKIADILSELATTDIGLDGTGYNAGDLDALIGELASVDTRLGRTVKDKAQTYADNDIRQLVLYYALPQYEQVVSELTAQMELRGVDDFADVVAHMLGLIGGNDANIKTE